MLEEIKPGVLDKNHFDKRIKSFVIKMSGLPGFWCMGQNESIFELNFCKTSIDIWMQKIKLVVRDEIEFPRRFGPKLKVFFGITEVSIGFTLVVYSYKWELNSTNQTSIYEKHDFVKKKEE